MRRQIELLDSDYQKALTANRNLQKIIEQKYMPIADNKKTVLVDPETVQTDVKNNYLHEGNNSNRNQGVSDSSQKGSRNESKITGHLKQTELTPSEIEAYANVKKYDRKKNAVVPLIDSEFSVSGEYLLPFDIIIYKN